MINISVKSNKISTNGTQKGSYLSLTSSTSAALSLSSSGMMGKLITYLKLWKFKTLNGVKSKCRNPWMR